MDPKQRRKKSQQRRSDVSKLENLRNNQEIKQFYKCLNKLRNGSQTTSTFRGKDGGFFNNKTYSTNDEPLNGEDSSSQTRRTLNPCLWEKSNQPFKNLSTRTSTMCGLYPAIETRSFLMVEVEALDDLW